MAIGVITDILADKRVSRTSGKPYTAYVVTIDGTPYEFGFKAPAFNKGDTVSFETERKFGKQQIMEGTLGKAAAGAASSPPKTGASGGGGWGGKGVFPVPKNDGQRSIIRQNAVTNARAIVADCGGLLEGESVEQYAARVIATAELIEQYTTGDLDTFTASDPFSD